MRKPHSNKFIYITTVFVILIAISTIFGIVSKQTSKKIYIPKKHTINIQSPAKNSTQSSNQQQNISNNSIQNHNSSNNTAQANNSVQLIQPYGALVSNHQPGQNGSNLNEESECITTPGAYCIIKFTDGNIVKSLPQKQTNSYGIAYWYWNVGNLGLTNGNWQITAIASMSSQSISTTDKLRLEVQ